MKILYACNRINIDAGSAPIGTCKFLLTIAELGHQVRCLTAESAPLPDPVHWLPGIPITRVSDLAPDSGWAARASSISAGLRVKGSFGKMIATRAGHLSAFATGYDLTALAQIARWRVALRKELARGYDLVFVRAAGVEFFPHLAMIEEAGSTPWIANYHDPYPYSRYPEPYRMVVPVVSAKQDQRHRRILASAAAVTFPSRRLLEWMLSGEFEPVQAKATILPHIARELPGVDRAEVSQNVVEPGTFSVIHAGTLLGARRPGALTEGFHRFVGSDPERLEKARLIFVGGVDRRHRANTEWQQALQHSCIRIVDHRVSYGEALAMTRAATAALVIEAEAEVSPFYPAKLADYVYLGKPVIAVSPPASSVYDLLGSDYPLLARAADAESVTRALTILWEAWKSGDTARLAPPERLTRQIGTEAAREIFSKLLPEAARRRRQA